MDKFLKLNFSLSLSAASKFQVKVDYSDLYENFNSHTLNKLREACSTHFQIIADDEYYKVIVVALDNRSEIPHFFMSIRNFLLGEGRNYEFEVFVNGTDDKDDFAKDVTIWKFLCHPEFVMENTVLVLGFIKFLLDSDISIYSLDDPFKLSNEIERRDWLGSLDRENFREFVLRYIPELSPKELVVEILIDKFNKIAIPDIESIECSKYDLKNRLTNLLKIRDKFCDYFKPVYKYTLGLWLIPEEINLGFLDSKCIEIKGHSIFCKSYEIKTHELYFNDFVRDNLSEMLPPENLCDTSLFLKNFYLPEIEINSDLLFMFENKVKKIDLNSMYTPCLVSFWESIISRPALISDGNFFKKFVFREIADVNYQELYPHYEYTSDEITNLPFVFQAGDKLLLLGYV